MQYGLVVVIIIIIIIIITATLGSQGPRDDVWYKERNVFFLDELFKWTDSWKWVIPICRICYVINLFFCFKDAFFGLFDYSKVNTGKYYIIYVFF